MRRGTILGRLDSEECQMAVCLLSTVGEAYIGDVSQRERRETSRVIHASRSGPATVKVRWAIKKLEEVVM
jgi:hypothetical protein